MKATSILFAILCASISLPAAAPAPAIAERGPHHRTWERVTTQSLPGGRTLARKSGYTELAAGMHFFKDGQWQESRDEIELFQDGAVARNGQHQVIFAPNLATPGAIDLQTPDGHRFRTHVLGLVFYDAATGNSELVAEVKDCLGELHPPNVVQYPDAFTGVQASVRYTYARGFFEQDAAGHLTNLIDGKGTTNTYTSAGRLRTRTWARGVTTTYHTNAAGEIVATTYSDGTPAVTNHLDRLGRRTNVLDGTGSRLLSYDTAGRLLLETNASGVLSNISVAYAYDALGRRTNTSAFDGSTLLAAATYAYDSASRLTNVSDGTYSAAYSSGLSPVFKVCFS